MKIIIFCLSIGSSILISQSVGEKDIEKAKDYAASMIKFHNIIPVGASINIIYRTIYLSAKIPSCKVF